MADNTYRYLSTLIEAGSFSKAATKLDISQPSLSQYVQRLESDMGTELVERTARPLRLTYAGECFMSTEKQISQLRQTRDKLLADIEEGIRGHVRIGSSHYRSCFFLSAVLPVFRREHPEIEISLVEGTTNSLETEVLNGNTDLSVVLMPVDHPGLTVTPLYKERLLLAVPSDSPAVLKAKKNKGGDYDSLSFKALDKLPFITIARGQKFHELFIELSEKTGSRPKVVLESASPMAALTLTGAGLGSCFVTETLAKRYPFVDNKVTFFRLDPDVPAREVVLATVTGQYLSKATQELIDTMKTVAMNQFRNG